jgi:hypothetical protein
MNEDVRALDLETLLADALRPIEPPETVASRLEATLASITEHAAAELSSWAEELSEAELSALRDPRNWVRPVVAVAAGTAAGGALLVVEMRRRRHETGRARRLADELMRAVRPG